MNDVEMDRFERELRQLNPATPPPPLVDRLAIEPDCSSDHHSHVDEPPATSAGGMRWANWIRWLAPIAGTAVVAAVFWLHRTGERPVSVRRDTVAADQWMPEEIEVDRQLMVAFEGVARLPDGMPFRFRYYGWDEEFVARDASGTVEVRQRQPRAEIVPVTMAVY